MGGNCSISYFKGLFKQVAAMGGDQRKIDTNRENTIAQEMLKGCNNEKVVDFMQKFIGDDSTAPAASFANPSKKTLQNAQDGFVKFDKRAFKTDEKDLFHNNYLNGANNYHAKYDNEGRPLHNTYFDKKGNVLAEEFFTNQPTGVQPYKRTTTDGSYNEQWQFDKEGNISSGERTMELKFPKGNTIAHQEFIGEKMSYEYQYKGKELVSITVPIEIGNESTEFVCLVDNGKLLIDQGLLEFFEEGIQKNPEYSNVAVMGLINEKLQSIQNEIKGFDIPTTIDASAENNYGEVFEKYYE